MHKLKVAMFALVVALATAQTAHAKHKYTRTNEVKVEVKLSERSKPVQGHDVKPTKPTLTAEDAMLIEGLKGTFQAEQRQILKNLIRDTPDSEPDEKADYYFRLGELAAKQHRFWRLKAIEFAIAADGAKTAGDKTRIKGQSEDAAKKAKEFLVEAVTTYKEMTDKDAFKNYPKMDMALFYYGYTLQTGRYLKEARVAFDKLLKNYPSSKYVPEAHYAFAEYFFEVGQLADAEARYQKVLEFPKSSVFWFAKYKTGWIDLNLERPQQALETFYEVANATKTAKGMEVLHSAAKKDFVRAYAEVGKAEKAFVAFKRVDDKKAFDMLGILADLYLDQGKSAQAIFTYQELMRLAPSNKNVCLWQYNVAHATMSMPRTNTGDTAKDVVHEIENLVRLHTALKSKKVLPKAEAQECYENSAAMSGELARAYHSEAARTKNPATLAHAEKLYKAYLDGFPEAADYAQTQYYYSELLWARAEAEKDGGRASQMVLWEQAANAFARVLKTGKLEPKLMREAAYAQVLGWKNALDVDPRPKFQAEKTDDPEKVYSKVPEKKPIPESEQKMLAAFDIYIKYIKDSPNDEDLAGMKFLGGNLYRRYNHFDEAIARFKDVLANHSEHETAEFSANLLLDTYNRMKDYKSMLALAEKLGADKKFLDGKEDLAERLAGIKITSMRKEAEDLEKRGRASHDYALLTACGEAYMDIYNSNPVAKENDQILHNALVCYHEGKSVSAAISAFDTMQKYYPTSKLMPRAIGRIGKAFGDVAFYGESAEKLDQFARKFAAEKDAPKAMNDAVFYFKGVGKDDKAIDATKYFIRTFGTDKPQDAANAHFSLTSIYEKQGDGDLVVKHLREYVGKFGAKGGADRLVIAHSKIGQTLWAQSCPVKQIDGACVKIVRERAFRMLAKTKRGAGSGHLRSMSGGIEQPKQCGPESKIKMIVVERDARKVKDAMAAFEKAQKEFEKTGGKTGGDEAGAKYYFAQSKLAVADHDFESYLGYAFPQGLNFDKNAPSIREKSMKRFDGWVADKTKVGAKATAQYEAILKVQDSATSIAAAARIGQVSQNFSDALFTAEIPKDVRTGQFADEKVEAFCDRMTEVAEPLEKRSLEAFAVCLNKSTELGWFSDWSKLCERELGQIKPEDYPTAAELRGTPRIATVIAVEPPIKRLE